MIKKGGKIPERLLSEGGQYTSLKEINKHLKLYGYKLKYYGYSIETTELLFEFIPIVEGFHTPSINFLRVYSIGDIKPEEAAKTLLHVLRRDDPKYAARASNRKKRIWEDDNLYHI